MMANFKLKLTNWIVRIFPSEAAKTILHFFHLANLPKRPRLMTINQWGLRLVYAVLVLQSLLLLVWLGGVL